MIVGEIYLIYLSYIQVEGDGSLLHADQDRMVLDFQTDISKCLSQRHRETRKPFKHPLS